MSHLAGPIVNIVLLHVSNLLLEILELLVNSCILLGHLLVLGLPCITVLLERLNLALEMSSFYISLAESEQS